ncbi:MAG: trypsin-like peptidase domain-containing protein [Bacteroidota bacterium]|nr:trypsin-like peptidase domain-containing protein [Bacteroidota bacterium]
MKRILWLAALSIVVSTLTTLAIVNWKLSSISRSTSVQVKDANGAKFTSYSSENVSFVEASRISTPCVVYIKTLIPGQKNYDDFFNFFGNVGPATSTGSGVIVTNDGYIVTNYHVIKGAETIDVILNRNKKSYRAKVVGQDPGSDLALLKIEAKDLPFIAFSNSDLLPVGEWVLAVGNPFNLNSTVTAGIVSAKGRNINIVKNNFPIESFIQTDAAINPGNSGGALVDLSGKLIGINSAIYSQTGSYSGYGFAIPSNIVKKIIADLKEYGFVQRAVIEAKVEEISDEYAKKNKLTEYEGLVITDIYSKGNADKAGLKKGDIIKAFNKTKIYSRAELDEQLAYNRPGDMISLTLNRNDKLVTVNIKLNNVQGNTSLEQQKYYHSETLGADLFDISQIDKSRLKIENGVRVDNISSGGYFGNLGIPDGFIIVKLNNTSVDKADDVKSALEQFRGRLYVEGYTNEGNYGSFSFVIY